MVWSPTVQMDRGWAYGSVPFFLRKGNIQCELIDNFRGI